MIKKAHINDVSQIIEICDEAKRILKDNNIDQWQNGYPNEDSFINDISKGSLYVYWKDNIIIGMVCITFEVDKTYANITEGSWLNDDKYIIVHRIAVRERYLRMGIAMELLAFCEEIAKQNNIFNIKVDTHEKNFKMKALLEKNGYIMCGIVYVSNDREINIKRCAYQKVLKNNEERVGKKMFCRSCGRQVSEEDAFCSGCGNALKEVADVKNTEVVDEFAKIRKPKNNERVDSKIVAGMLITNEYGFGKGLTSVILSCVDLVILVIAISLLRFLNPVSLVLSLLSFVAGILSVTFGAIAITKATFALRNKVRAIAPLVLGILGTALSGILVIYNLIFVFIFSFAINFY